MVSAADYRVPPRLLAKYAKAGPRYTSYPTAPEWSAEFNAKEALSIYQANNASHAEQPLAFYFHIPFCTSLCYYCACNVKISHRKEVAGPYLNALKQELTLVGAELASPRQVSQMHWGGGTPTYLSPEQITELVAAIRQQIAFTSTAELSIEVDPRVTTPEHIQALSAAGFNRLSMGVQDFNPQVQQTVHRIQGFELTQNLIQTARKAGFKSINIDLMYGLPHQTEVSFAETLVQVQALNPDRLALFHYAHVPWLKKHQRLIPEEALPASETKLAIFEMAIQHFLDTGYVYIGMDHFAKPEDELTQAQQAHTLRRNFMGYTTQAGVDLYGFGATAIGEVDGHFIQNAHSVKAYQDTLASGQLPVMRGMRLGSDDHLRKQIIENLICNGYLDFQDINQRFEIDFHTYFKDELAASAELAADGLIDLTDQNIWVRPRGQMLIRNICMLWDAYLKQIDKPRRFSQTA